MCVLNPLNSTLIAPSSAASILLVSVIYIRMNQHFKKVLLFKRKIPSSSSLTNISSTLHPRLNTSALIMCSFSTLKMTDMAPNLVPLIMLSAVVIEVKFLLCSYEFRTIVSDDVP